MVKKKSNLNNKEVTEYDVQKMEEEKRKAQLEVEEIEKKKKESTTNVAKLIADRIKQLIPNNPVKIITAVAKNVPNDDIPLGDQK